MKRIKYNFGQSVKRPLVYIPLIIFFIVILYLAILVTPLSSSNTNQVITIKPGTNVQEVSELLYEKGIIKYPKRFILATKMMGKERKLCAGRFDLYGAINYYELIKTLSDLESVTVRVTIPEGLRAREIARLLENQIGISADDFMQKVMDSRFTHQLGVEANNLEGYLFPDSYHFIVGDSPENVISRMVERFWEVVNDSVQAEIRRTGYTLHQIITLASIVEGECQVDFERPLVASLYYNRLRRRIRLEACPTIQYIIPDSPRRILRQDLKIDSPYNTYLHYGLPPGPVCNPGFKSIKAAIYPAKTKYLYMVSNGDSTYTHTFTANYEEFLAAKRKLQKIRTQDKLVASEDYIN
ncbi:MAG TPA: endolytic transglycosylase MltG [Candidatus Marinimicrobia bacterium]|nr:endolytic transglycosylase MltG [Candidatus Neomarinimicrobiota bacterium]